MTRPIIYPYKLTSASAIALAEGLDTKRVRVAGRYRPRPDDLIVNWGNSTPPLWLPAARRVLNAPAKVFRAAHKDATLAVLQTGGVNTPKWTMSSDEARAWGTPVYCRTTLTGHSGEGIEYRKSGEELAAAPLYTCSLGKRIEFRIHVFADKVIDIQQKRLRNGTTNPNNVVRSHANGWVYTRGDVSMRDEGKDTAIRAVAALGLDFGAVDLVYTARPERTTLSNPWAVLEVNTAPGLTGTTLTNYINAIKELCQ